MASIEAEAIAASRPPDEVLYSDWEAIYGTPYKKLVATRYSLFTVLEYTEVEVVPVTGWRRKRWEVWMGKAHNEPVVTPFVPSASYDDNLRHDLMVTLKHVDAYEIARWAWEYSSGNNFPNE